jgi:hypothetical protein
MKHGTRVAFVVGGSGIVAIALLMTAAGAPASLAVTHGHGVLERPAMAHSNRLDETHAHSTSQEHTPVDASQHRSSSRSASSPTTSTTTPTTTTTPAVTSTTVTTTTAPSSPPQSTTQTTKALPAVQTTRFVSGRLAPPFTSTTAQQQTLTGVLSIVLTWSGNTPLRATLTCGGRSQQRSGTDGLYLAVHATVGSCSIDIAEVPPSSPDVVSYELELSYQTATT